MASGSNVIFLAYSSPKQIDDEMSFAACRVCRNKTYTHTYVGNSGFPLVRCAACGAHIGRIGWADENDVDKADKPGQA